MPIPLSKILAASNFDADLDGSALFYPWTNKSGYRITSTDVAARVSRIVGLTDAVIDVGQWLCAFSAIVYFSDLDATYPIFPTGLSTWLALFGIIFAGGGIAAKYYVIMRRLAVFERVGRRREKIKATEEIRFKLPLTMLAFSLLGLCCVTVYFPEILDIDIVSQKKILRLCIASLVLGSIADSLKILHFPPKVLDERDRGLIEGTLALRRRLTQAEYAIVPTYSLLCWFFAASFLALVFSWGLEALLEWNCISLNAIFFDNVRKCANALEEDLSAYAFLLLPLAGLPHRTRRWLGAVG